MNEYVSPETKEYYSAYVNFSGRGFPDVSAHSLDPDFTVYQDGEQTPSGGTSAASPVAASIIALLNDARLRSGKPALGFLNPFIYAFGYQGFTDITAGQSDGCNGNDTQTGGPLAGAGVIPGAHWTRLQVGTQSLDSDHQTLGSCLNWSMLVAVGMAHGRLAYVADGCCDLHELYDSRGSVISGT